VPENQSKLAWDTLLEISGPGALHVRLTGALRGAIRSGVLPAASVLPPSRVLAADLGCSRWVVTEAYQQLLAEGYVQARVGSGTRVVWREERAGGSDHVIAAEPGGTPAIDLAPGLPDLRRFPVDRWLAALRAAATTQPRQQLRYPTPGGEPALQRVLAAYLRRVRGAAAEPGQVTVCNGVTDAVTRLCAAARAAGIGAVAVEDPGWTRLRAAIASTGLAVVPIPTDEHGIRADQLDHHPQVRMVVVAPAHHFPTGVVLTPSRRGQLLDWARRADGLVVEDDYDAEFRYDRRPVGTTQGTDPTRVALAGSVSKTLAPALGIGWLLTPARWTAAVRTTPQPTGPPMLDQLGLAAFIDSGDYDRHLRASRRRYRTRRDALVSALTARLPGCTVSGAAAGLHLLLHPPAATADGPTLARRAAARGVQVGYIQQYRVQERPSDATLVLGYGNLADADITQAVSAIAEAIGDGPPSTAPAPPRSGIGAH
jgi:GntR family transcriptional regulator / MocR family aminotransferase